MINQRNYVDEPMKKVILVIGDSHIPERALEIDREIIDYIRSKIYDIVVHTGDLVGEEVLRFVESLSSSHYVVQGNMDYLDLPEKEVFEVYGIRIGVIHGDQVRPRGNIAALSSIARSMDVKILLSGHTHSPFAVFDIAGILHVNPGSVTGVWGGGGGSMTPSFAEIEITKNKLVHVKLYELTEAGLVLRREEKYQFV
jgi:putative phosphoesterase